MGTGHPGQALQQEWVPRGAAWVWSWVECGVDGMLASAGVPALRHLVTTEGVMGTTAVTVAEWSPQSEAPPARSDLTP